MKLSVVMAVYNGAASVRATLDSIAAQSERDFELIVIDDGSTDSTPAILREYAARDARLQVMTQPNVGLTRSLIRGCDTARAAVIARHDCGDLSHPERFARQLDVLERGAQTVLVSSWTRVRAPGGELLFEVRGDGPPIRDGLLRAPAATIRGIPHHGTAMFRRDAYRAAGGYREAFRYAQDLDLWIRLAALGEIVVVPEVLYEPAVDVGTLSSLARPHQVELTEIAVALRDDRTRETEALLARAANVMRKRARTSRDDARALYFIASCLYGNGDDAWRRYARAAVRHDPLHLRTWALFLRGLLPRGRRERRPA